MVKQPNTKLPPLQTWAHQAGRWCRRPSSLTYKYNTKCRVCSLAHGFWLIRLYLHGHRQLKGSTKSLPRKTFEVAGTGFVLQAWWLSCHSTNLALYKHWRQANVNMLLMRHQLWLPQQLELLPNTQNEISFLLQVQCFLFLDYVILAVQNILFGLHYGNWNQKLFCCTLLCPAPNRREH